MRLELSERLVTAVITGTSLVGSCILYDHDVYIHLMIHDFTGQSFHSKIFSVF